MHRSECTDELSVVEPALCGVVVVVVHTTHHHRHHSAKSVTNCYGVRSNNSRTCGATLSLLLVNTGNYQLLVTGFHLPAKIS